jgi:NADPH-dependent 2,4-dienoyl-CoA reductase/sulfur reductase-like enzyme
MDMTSTPTPRQLVVIGGGNVARRLIDALRARDEAGQWAVTLLCEEPRAPYDRVALTSYFTGRDPEDLALGGQEIWDDPLVTIRRGVAATGIDREARTVATSDGRISRRAGERMPIIPEYLRKQYRDLITQHTAALARRMGEQRIDYALFDTSKPLDRALFTYLLARQRFNRVR